MLTQARANFAAMSLPDASNRHRHTDILQSQDLGHSAMSVLAAKPGFIVAPHSLRTTCKRVFGERSLEFVHQDALLV